MMKINDDELERILQDDSDTEKEDTLVIDSNIDAYRVNSGSMPGKCITDFTYVFE